MPYDLIRMGSRFRSAIKISSSVPGSCRIGDPAGIGSAGVASLKIEGRLKSPEYVANITRIYRQALDGLAERDCRKIEDDLVTTRFANMKWKWPSRAGFTPVGSGASTIRHWSMPVLEKSAASISVK